MLRVTIHFPLGVYHAQSVSAFGEPEWPPSPVRLIGALLAAAHEAPGIDTASARSLLDRLCSAGPPRVLAPAADSITRADGRAVVAKLRGASRWAPRNHSEGELKAGLSPRNIGRERAEVHKGGVAIGAAAVHVEWPDLVLGAAERAQLARLGGEVTSLGASRSPAIVTVADTPAPSEDATADRSWRPQAGGVAPDGAVSVRVPEPELIDAFDRRHAARRSAKPRLEPARDFASPRLGRELPYVLESLLRARRDAEPLDPRWWGDAIILQLDPECSELRPNGAAAYLLARATRAAVLGGYGAAGTSTEAPAVLRGRGDEPHVAIVPLPFVGHEHADGGVRGVAILLPHEIRSPDVVRQRTAVERGLLRFVSDSPASPRRWVDIPGAGRVWLRLPPPGQERLETLREGRYRTAARRWVSVTPVVHSRWRTNRSSESLWAQVAADCGDVGLPEPIEVERLRAPALHGSPAKLADRQTVPDPWRRLLDGPVGHVRVTFSRPVRGPLLLGRARHFGLGLCLPAADDQPEEGAR